MSASRFVSAPCPHCGAAPRSSSPSADGTVWAVCGGCGMSYQLASPPGAPIPVAGPQPAPSRGRKRGLFGCFIGVPGALAGVLIPIVFIFCPKACASLDGGHQVALDALRACPRAQQVLGDDIDAAWVGSSTGESSSGPSSGQADWSFTVTGARGRGEYSFHARKDAAGWHLVSGTLMAGGQIVQLPGGCDAPGAFAPTAPTMPGFPSAPPSAPTPPPSDAPGDACARMQRCCDVAGTRQTMDQLCRTLPLVRMTANGESTCEQLLTSSRALLGTQGSVPPECQ